MALTEQQEWLEPDGLGGFASGTATGVRTRRYQALLLSAATPPTGRQVLVSGIDTTIETDGGTVSLSSHRYAPDVVHPDGVTRIESFTTDPWPSWRFRLDEHTVVEQSIFVAKGLPITVVRWARVSGSGPVRLRVRPFLAGRDYHALHHENGALIFSADRIGGVIRWRPYDGVQPILAVSNGVYQDSPDWYRNFLYAQERARGLDAVEDLAVPGLFEWDLTADATLIFAAETAETRALLCESSPLQLATELADNEKTRREKFHDRLDRAADAYIVRRGSGATIVAGYPWFTDWGRDTFIAIRGLCLATGRYKEAGQILLQWADAVSEGMLPNRFPDAGDAPEFNAVDASLWYIVAAHEWLQADPAVSASERTRIQSAIDAILDGYARGTRFGIRADDDGLLAAGVPGVQLTWMDARVGDRVITPRIGKPVEVQALWINALWIGAHLSSRWKELFARASGAFETRFWNESSKTLYDVIDVDHARGSVDPTIRPNQILAVGGLPLSLLDGDRARRVVDAVERELLTPLGLRSLSPADPAYIGRYAGGVAARDTAYHQGTVWPWLLGPFVDAWVRTRGGTNDARREARRRFLEPLLMSLDSGGLGHLPEVADGDAPHAPGGCPFQAWSVGEALRLDRVVLAQPARRPKGAAPRKPASTTPSAVAGIESRQ
jgi:predicted glycogen debranching enzyme